MFRSLTDDALAAKHDPEPYIHHERAGDYRHANGPECMWDCGPIFAPRVECIPSRDPAPWVALLGGRSASHMEHGRFDPRPEYARPPVNQLLHALRQYPKDEWASCAAYILRQIETEDSLRARTPDWPTQWPNITPDEIAHARKVLTRLAALS